MYQDKRQHYTKQDIDYHINLGKNMIKQIDYMMQSMPENSDVYKYLNGIQTDISRKIAELQTMKSGTKTNNAYIVNF